MSKADKLTIERNPGFVKWDVMLGEDLVFEAPTRTQCAAFVRGVAYAAAIGTVVAWKDQSL